MKKVQIHHEGRLSACSHRQAESTKEIDFTAKSAKDEKFVGWVEPFGFAQDRLRDTHHEMALVDDGYRRLAPQPNLRELIVDPLPLPDFLKERLVGFSLFFLRSLRGCASFRQ